MAYDWQIRAWTKAADEMQRLFLAREAAQCQHSSLLRKQMEREAAMADHFSLGIQAYRDMRSREAARKAEEERRGNEWIAQNREDLDCFSDGLL